MLLIHCARITGRRSPGGNVRFRSDPPIHFGSRGRIEDEGPVSREQPLEAQNPSVARMGILGEFPLDRRDPLQRLADAPATSNGLRGLVQRLLA